MYPSLAEKPRTVGWKGNGPIVEVRLEPAPDANWIAAFNNDEHSTEHALEPSDPRTLRFYYGAINIEPALNGRAGR